MPSELDRRFDEELSRVTGPGGTLVVGRDELGREIVQNFPATLPHFFRTFCAFLVSLTRSTRVPPASSVVP